MNTEEKAKAYDEALERARRIKNREDNWRYSDLTEIIPALEEVLPELAESEDERIRKGIIEIIKAVSGPDCDVYLDEKKQEKYLAYLEKQKENPKSADSIPSDCISDAKCEDRWYKVTDSLPDNGRLVLAKDCLGNVLLARYDGENWEVNVYDNEDHYCHNSISKWCEIPSEKQQESLHIPETSKENANSFTDEDEMIRRWLCDYFSSIDKAWIHKDITCIDILRWLEKQKEQKEELVYRLNGLMQDYIKEGKDDEEKEHRLKCYQLFWDALEDTNFFEQKEQKPISSCDIVPYIDDKIAALQDMWREEKVAFDWDDMHEMIEDVARHFYHKEQKPAEWSEEDERMIGRIRSVVNECASYNDALDVNGDYCEGDYAKLDAWLKSLPLNLKKKNEDVAKLCSNEWSIEDEDRIRQIERIAQKAGCTEKLQEEIHDWLKSLRPSWKPSKEQMEALNALNCHGALSYVGQQNQLISLYQDLKKLM